ncbi:MAG: hypothetical protein ACM678_08150 [Clostridiales bacterium]
MMGEQHKKHNRREHLNDFHLNVAGEYVYDGALYACQSSEEKQHRIKRAVWGMAAILIVAVIAGGCIPAPGMQNCFYVLLPYLGEFLGAASVIWALAKLGMDWGTVREYNYKKSVAVLPVRTAVTAVFSLLGIVCELIFFFVNDHAGQTFFALLYVLLKLIALLSALVLRAEIMQAEWDKLPKKDNS